MKNFKKYLTARNVFTVTLCLLLVVSVCIGIGGIVAKYTSKEETSNTVVPTDFVFTSSMLSDAAEPPVYCVFGNVARFELSNTDGLNIAEEQFVATVTATEGSGALGISGVEGAFDGNVTFAGGTADSKVLVFTANEGTTEATVTASVTAPYTKTISAKFVFYAENSAYYTVTADRESEADDYIVVDLYTGPILPENGITVNYGAAFLPDNTHPAMVGLTNTETNSGKLVGLAPNSHYKLIFYENTFKNYTNVSRTELNETNGYVIDLTAVAEQQ